MEGTYTKNGWQQTTQKNLKYIPEGRRNVGRPLTRWEDGFREEGTGQGAEALYLMHYDDY